MIRELAERPFNPMNPILAASDAPHAFFSPYTLMLGLLVRWTCADAVNFLTAVGIANLAVFLVAIPSLRPNSGRQSTRGADPHRDCFTPTLGMSPHTKSIGTKGQRPVRPE